VGSKLHRPADPRYIQPSNWGTKLFHPSRSHVGSAGTFTLLWILTGLTLYLSRPCRQGFSSRCSYSLLFGSPALEGGQAQYVRVPCAGGTLFCLNDIELNPTTGSRLATLADSSLLLLADILPTGYFAALQLLQHPKLVPLLKGNPYPRPTLALSPAGESVTFPSDVLNIALIGLGPVGIVRTTPPSMIPKRFTEIQFHSHRALPSVSWTSSGKTESRTTGSSLSIRMNNGGNLSRRSIPNSSKPNLGRLIPIRPLTPSILGPQKRRVSPQIRLASMAS